MSKTLISNPVFGKPEEQIGFNLAPNVNVFNSIFTPKQLDTDEENKIQNLLFDNFQIEESSNWPAEERLKIDIDQLKAITAEIKAIQKQSIVLLGERIEKAQNLLKSYKDGTFTIWLKDTFNSKQTGYNILAYYEFYKSLPTLELKELFKKLPKRAAYTLASRTGDLELKLQILNHFLLFDSESSSNILVHIRDRLPLADDDRRRSKGEISLLIDSLYKTTYAIQKRGGKLTDECRKKLIEIRSVLDQFLSV
jgi:energy-converting hydrogenase A subunit M